MYYSGENCSVQAIDYFHAWWWFCFGLRSGGICLLNIKRPF